MTSLHGEFECDLPLEEAVAACSQAFQRLGWESARRGRDRVVSWPNGTFGEEPAVEVDFNQSEDSTEVQIIGVDPSNNALDDRALIAILDRARDAIGDAMSTSSSSAPATAAVNGHQAARPDRFSYSTEIELPAEGAASTPTETLRTNPLAIVSMVLGVTWLLGVGSLLAILLGGISLRQIEYSGGLEAGRGLAMAAIVLGTIGAIATIGAAIVKFGS